MGKLHQHYKHNTVKKTVSMSLDNNCKRKTTLDNEARTQIATAQASLTKIEETEDPDALQNACKKRQLSIKNKTR